MDGKTVKLTLPAGWTNPRPTDPKAAIARVRANLIARYRLRVREGYPEELEAINDHNLGVAVAYASQAVWIKPMNGRKIVSSQAINLSLFTTWPEVRKRVGEILDQHFNPTEAAQ
jgi:hypothetical protein